MYKIEINLKFYSEINKTFNVNLHMFKNIGCRVQLCFNFLKHTF